MDGSDRTETFSYGFNASNPLALAVHNESLYFTDTESPAVYMVPSNGLDVITIAETVSISSALVFYDSQRKTGERHLFFLEGLILVLVVIHRYESLLFR